MLDSVTLESAQRTPTGRPIHSTRLPTPISSEQEAGREPVEGTAAGVRSGHWRSAPTAGCGILARSPHPPIGALGLAPQKTRVPIIPMMCTKTMFKTIDLAVAVPTPTGPPEAV